MKVEKTKLDGVLLITPDVFKDHRGEYIETYNDKEFWKIDEGSLYDVEFVQDDVSISKCNVLRGIHGDFKTWKLVSCLSGVIQLVVVNNMLDTPQYYKHTEFILSDINHQQVLIPPGFGNGHKVLSEKAIFHYKQSTYYDPELQFTLAWDDPELEIGWVNPLSIVSSIQPITSDRDSDICTKDILLDSFTHENKLSPISKIQSQ